MTDVILNGVSVVRRASVRSILLVLCFAFPIRAAGQAFDVDAPPAFADLAARIERADAESLARSLARAGLELPPRVRVTLIPFDDPRGRAVAGWVTAQAFGTEEIVIFPERILSYPYDSLESVVLHEIVHLSLNVRAAGRPLPRWFHEGVAVSVEAGWGIGSQIRLLFAAAREPDIAEVGALFRSDRQPETTTAYLLSAALVEDVRRRHGLDVPGAIAGRVARGAPFDRAFLAETGETVDEAAARAWTVYRGIRWLPVVTSGSAIWGLILVLAFLAFAVRRRPEMTGSTTKRIARIPNASGERMWSGEGAERITRVRIGSRSDSARLQICGWREPCGGLLREAGAEVRQG